MQGRRSLGNPLEKPMQQNPNRIRRTIPLLQVGCANLQESSSMEEKNPSKATMPSLIKGEEELNTRSPNTMANSEHDGKEVDKFAKIQDGESSSKNEAEPKEEISDQPEIHGEKEEEEKFKLIPGDWWYCDEDRERFFFGLHLKLSYLQIYLPFLEAMETDPRYAKFCKGPSSREIEILMQQYLPVKRKDPGSFSLEIIFANKHTARGLIDLGASCSIMPFSIYKKIGALKLKPSYAYLKMADKTRKKAMGALINQNYTYILL